jgi:hypothetical protein
MASVAQGFRRVHPNEFYFLQSTRCSGGQRQGGRRPVNRLPRHAYAVLKS